jgi:hypothetical protein
MSKSFAFTLGFTTFSHLVRSQANLAKRLIRLYQNVLWSKFIVIMILYQAHRGCQEYFLIFGAAYAFIRSQIRAFILSIAR